MQLNIILLQFSAPCPPSSSRNVVVMQQNDVGHPSLFAPSYSDSPSSSGNTSLLGTLADTISKSTGDLNEIDLDSSLADLSAFQVNYCLECCLFLLES